MNSRIFIAFLLTAVVLSFDAQAPGIPTAVNENDWLHPDKWAQENLMHPAKSIRLEGAKITGTPGHWTEDPVRLYRAMSFDPFGNITKWISYDEKGEVSSSQITLVDAKGKQLEHRSLNKDGSVRSRMEYLFDGEGREIGYQTYDPQGKPWHKIIHARFDSQGRFIENTTYGADGKVQDVCHYTFDDIARTMSTKCDGEKDKPYGRMSWKYNAKGFPIDQTNLDTEGNVILRSIFRRDSKGRQIEYKRFQIKRGVGTLLEHTKSEYKEDEYGSWIKQIDYNCYTRFFIWVTCEPRSVTYRKITYYPAEIGPTPTK